MMNPRYSRILVLALSIIMLLSALGNLIFTLFLRHELPNLIKKNSHYSINYSSLDVELGSGAILAKKVQVKSKNPSNNEVIGLEGSVEELSIKNLGLIRLVTKGRFQASDLILHSPNLTLTLAKPVDSKTGKKRSPMPFRNILISNGKIEIFRHTKQNFLKVSNLDLEVSGLKLSEQGIKSELPVVFDNYSIAGKNFAFWADDLYRIAAKEVTTEEGKMSIKLFEIQPQIPYNQFITNYPNKSNYIHLIAKELNFTDIALNKNKLALSQAVLESPELIIQSGNAKKSKSDNKKFKYIFDLKGLELNNAKIQLLKKDGSAMFQAEDLDLVADNILVDEKTTQASIPFSYNKFEINGQNLSLFTKNQKIQLKQLQITPELIETNSINFSALNTSSKSASIQGKVDKLQLLINKWSYTHGELQLDASRLSAHGARLKINTSSSNKQPNKKRKGIQGFHFPLTLNQLYISGPEIQIFSGVKSQKLQQVKITGRNLKITEQSSSSGFPIIAEDYLVEFKNYDNRLNEFYKLAINNFQLKKNSIVLSGLELSPLMSRQEFIRKIPTERDLYSLKAKEIRLLGPMELLADQKYIDANSLLISGLNAQIFRSKIPPDDKKVKPMYSQMLREIKMPLRIKTMKIANSKLVYEEDTRKSDGPGKLVFSDLNLELSNLNSGKKAPFEIPIQITTKFMDVSPMEVNWALNTASKTDQFTIEGDVKNLPAEHINAFVEPYLKIRTTGYIEQLAFDFNGNRSTLGGTVKMKHKDLKVEVLKETGETNVLLSAVANLVVKSNSNPYPESVSIEAIERDTSKSFFNFFWKGVELGLKKTLIGNNVEKTEAAAKNTVETTKETVEQIKSDLSTAKEQVQQKVSEKKEKAQAQKKRSGLRNLFRKKEKKEE